MARRSRWLIFDPSLRCVGMRVTTSIAVSLNPRAATDPCIYSTKCSTISKTVVNAFLVGQDRREADTEDFLVPQEQGEIPRRRPPCRVVAAGKASGPASRA